MRSSAVAAARMVVVVMTIIMTSAKPKNDVNTDVVADSVVDDDVH